MSRPRCEKSSWRNQVFSNSSDTLRRGCTLAKPITASAICSVPKELGARMRSVPAGAARTRAISSSLCSRSRNICSQKSRYCRPSWVRSRARVEPVEEPHAQPCFEIADVARNQRARQAELIGREREAAGAHDPDETLHGPEAVHGRLSFKSASRKAWPRESGAVTRFSDKKRDQAKNRERFPIRMKREPL